MTTNHDNSTLKTLADVVTETSAAENEMVTATVAGSGSGPNVDDGVRVSNLSAEDLVVNAGFDGGGSVLVSEQVVHTEISVETMKVVVTSPHGPDSGLGEPNGENEASLGLARKANGEESGCENRRGPGEVNGSLSFESQMRDGDGDGVEAGNMGMGDLNHDGSDSKVEMEGGQEGSDDGEFMEEDHGYSVGDLVWGKIKSHPWWPGQIFDPSHASESAVKYKQKGRGRLLVAYFGDDSFAWCSPSQLVPFAQHFEDMSKQSSSKTFVNAVQEAVDEIGRLVELELTCKCLPEENQNGLTTRTAANAGIKPGVLVPDGDIGKLLSFRYDPAELLATVGGAAESVSFGSMLDLSILQSTLSAFYRARGGYKLPIYYGPLAIEGLEDKNGNETGDPKDFSVPIEVPIHRPVEDDFVSSAASGPGNDQEPQEDKIHHKRKQKSVAELMAGAAGAKPKKRQRSSPGEGTVSSNSAIKKQKFRNEAENRGGSAQAASDRKRGGKKSDDTSQSGEPDVSDSKSGSQIGVQVQERSLASIFGKARIKIPNSDNGEGMKGSDDMSSPRERRKSKYLSPPYTAPGLKAVNLGSKERELEKESEKITKTARIGERITKAAGKLLDSPSLRSCDGKTVEKNLPEGQVDNAENLNSQSGNQEQVTYTMDVSPSVNEVLSGLQSFASNALHLSEQGLLDFVGGFVLTFRSSVYAKASSQTRKSLNSKQAKLEGKSSGGRIGAKKSRQEKLNTETPKPKKSSKKNGEEKSNTPKPKKAAGGSGKKTENEQADRKSSPASLIVAFASDFSLPSKDDIVRTFMKFGELNEQETGVLPESRSVRISYARSSDAEEALRASFRQNPFGSANVNYKLCYLSTAPVSVESSAANVTPDPGSMTEKLQIMTSMLEKCEGKISSDAKANLDADIEVLFKKVKMIAETASSK